jgi:hypothetical protein
MLFSIQSAGSRGRSLDLILFKETLLSILCLAGKIKNIDRYHDDDGDPVQGQQAQLII